MQQHPAFYACGGKVLWRGIWLTGREVMHFIDLFTDECEAAFRAGDMPAYDRAGVVLAEVRAARRQAQDWLDQKYPRQRAA